MRRIQNVVVTTIAVATVGILASGVTAAVTTAGKTVTFCASKKTGAVRQVPKCSSKERKVVVGQQGPQGIQGVQGVQGIQGVKGNDGVDATLGTSYQGYGASTGVGVGTSAVTVATFTWDPTRPATSYLVSYKVGFNNTNATSERVQCNLLSHPSTGIDTIYTNDQAAAALDFAGNAASVTGMVTASLIVNLPTNVATLYIQCSSSAAANIKTAGDVPTILMVPVSKPIALSSS